MNKKPKKKRKDTSKLLFVHKNTYLASLQALGYYLTDLSKVYAENVKRLPEGHPHLVSLAQQIEVLGNIYNAFDSALEVPISVKKMYTDGDLH